MPITWFTYGAGVGPPIPGVSSGQEAYKFDE